MRRFFDQHWNYRIVPKTTPRYMKFSQIKNRAIHEVVLFQGSCYITFLKNWPINRSVSHSQLQVNLKIYLVSLCSVGHFHYINMSEVPNSASCYKGGRVIFEVVLYENSMKFFSHYIRGRVVIEVVLFSGLYGIAICLALNYCKILCLSILIFMNFL